MSNLSRKQLEEIRDSYSVGDRVKIIKNSWDRPKTISKEGVIVANTGDQFTPNIRVKVEGFFSSYTFSPDDIKPATTEGKK